jgi:hypothetical protein
MTHAIHPTHAPTHAPTDDEREHREHRLYRVPVAALLRRRRALIQTNQKALHIAATRGGAIEMRLDWNGDASPGQLEIDVAVADWRPCDNIEPDIDNDIIALDARPAGAPFVLRVHRGPLHPAAPFQVKAIPIAWDPALPLAFPPDFTAIRGTHYYYAPDEPLLATSQPIDGIHQLELILQLGIDYEVSASVRHPTDPNQWRLIDPVVRTDTNGGGQEQP